MSMTEMEVETVQTADVARGLERLEARMARLIDALREARAERDALLHERAVLARRVESILGTIEGMQVD